MAKKSEWLDLQAVRCRVGRLVLKRLWASWVVEGRGWWASASPHPGGQQMTRCNGIRQKRAGKLVCRAWSLANSLSLTYNHKWLTDWLGKRLGVRRPGGAAPLPRPPLPSRSFPSPPRPTPGRNGQSGRAPPSFAKTTVTVLPPTATTKTD